ncbi:hypothetical protein [Mycoplasma tauri]|uniref:hypothetical protein n=1 Tax=Mycoplasma tauri TaxID=547987 RepID=UPI0019685740|nr:hypothetical protein [Mycoplasma tauri]MBZ4204353.1 hypothetical protein [Mycoplasma tauri]MBZ4212619.1 hypothetical protein [Mycoplasma tauri]MBZ4218439.1 hypothetical protein [Mycoplasma tauri]MBZ4227053.1 hypothetical protein [Mycoplasma tauri]QSB07352.1 hypothetical protein JS510_02460 [Mycoplasma tauri]
MNKNFKRISQTDEKYIKGGIAFSTITAAISLGITAITKIVGVVKASYSSKGKISSTGSSEWDNKTSPQIRNTYEVPRVTPVYISY